MTNKKDNERKFLIEQGIYNSKTGVYTPVEKKSRFNFPIVSILLICSVAAMICFNTEFLLGFHDADLGQNLRFINAKYNLELIDQTMDGNLVTGIEAYIGGMSSMIFATYKMLISGICFGIILLYVYAMELNQNKKEEKKK